MLFPVHLFVHEIVSSSFRVASQLSSHVPSVCVASLLSCVLNFSVGGKSLLFIFELLQHWDLFFQLILLPPSLKSLSCHCLAGPSYGCILCDSGGRGSRKWAGPAPSSLGSLVH